MSIVNLNKARKARAKTKKRVQADANSVKFGRTRAEKDKEAREEKVRIRRVDLHKREEPPQK